MLYLSLVLLIAVAWTRRAVLGPECIPAPPPGVEGSFSSLTPVPKGFSSALMAMVLWLLPLRTKVFVPLKDTG